MYSNPEKLKIQIEIINVFAPSILYSAVLKSFVVISGVSVLYHLGWQKNYFVSNYFYICNLIDTICENMRYERYSLQAPCFAIVEINKSKLDTKQIFHVTLLLLSVCVVFKLSHLGKAVYKQK